MTAATKAALVLRPQSYCALFKIAVFHSSPVLERKRSSSSSGWLFSDKNAHKKKRSKEFLREHQETIRRAVKELKEEAAKKAKEKMNVNMSSRKRKFCYEDKDFDCIFRSLFGQSRGFDFSIHEEEERWWWHQPSWFSSSHSRRSTWRSKYRFYEGREDQEEEEEDYSSKNSRASVSESIIQASHRQTLGLSPKGPLSLEDIKQAYRNCAFQWHPDRHGDSTKAAAEEKFKLCTVAYQSLIKMLPIN